MSAIRSKLHEETVLNRYGIFRSAAALAKISGAFGQIRPCNPIGAIPKGIEHEAGHF